MAPASFTFRNACRRLGLKHIRTKPYTPKTNGKAERFVQTCLREWAYARAYLNSKQRAQALPFFAVGGGMKLYRGTGHEVAYQPLDNIALLTKTQQVKPMISVGGGIKMLLGPRLVLRAEVRDYITTFPKEVIVPLPGTKISGWLNDIVPMVGISYIF